VFATDFEVEAEMAKAEIGCKVLMISHEEFPVLMAGTQTRALELSREISYAIDRKATPLGEEYRSPYWESAFEEAIVRQKRNIANEIVSARFGLTYEDFLKIGKTSLPDDIFRDAVSDITQASLDCWLVVIAFNQTHPTLYRINSSGVVEICQNFAAIGSGYYIAESSLYQRNQNTDNDLGTTIYNVYEAMRLGSKAPGVGEKFQIVVVEWEYWAEKPTNEGNVKWSYLKPQYYEYLARQFARYGPRPIEKVRLRPGLIKEEQRAVILTPKGEHSEEHKKMMRRLAKAKATREAKKALAAASSTPLIPEKSGGRT